MRPQGAVAFVEPANPYRLR